MQRQKKISAGTVILFILVFTAANFGILGCEPSNTEPGGSGGCGWYPDNNSSDSNPDTDNSTTTDTDTDNSEDNNDDQGQVDPVVDGENGYATRYWDCCKPHCGWSDNVPGGINPVRTCNFYNVSNGEDYMVSSSCDGGDGFTCYNMAPYAVSDTLSYGYAAVSYRDDICGKCYQLEFKGTSYNAGDDPGSKALTGKTMIVQVTNTGGLVKGQFDLLIPGGGVGANDACTKQWGASPDDMGEQYGGLLSACKNELGWNAGHDAYKSCVSERCDRLFNKTGMEDLLAGCRWFVEWFEVADNPAFVFKEVECPDELNSVSGMLP